MLLLGQKTKSRMPYANIATKEGKKQGLEIQMLGKVTKWFGYNRSPSAVTEEGVKVLTSPEKTSEGGMVRSELGLPVSRVSGHDCQV